MQQLTSWHEAVEVRLVAEIECNKEFHSAAINVPKFVDLQARYFHRLEWIAECLDLGSRSKPSLFQYRRGRSFYKAQLLNDKGLCLDSSSIPHIHILLVPPLDYTCIAAVAVCTRQY
ncbi:hypothetical protein Tsubulata_006919 [Turnera subulata]|uniref:Uncharacterized protein n=1 Tax=Turnera subulata TaxID=218843 RepID=A0A9Q0GCK3_9ROSI|nr:hypothetical protein Tsubulata_006919 [Turnera subulata]